LSTGIIGIGALFFAYASASAVPFIGASSHHLLGILIAFIGLAATLALWMNIYASSQDRRSLWKILLHNDRENAAEFEEFRKWKHTGWWHRSFYVSVSNIAGYFMALVALSWLLILLRGILFTPLYLLVDLGAGGFAILFVIGLDGRCRELAYFDGQKRLLFSALASLNDIENSNSSAPTQRKC
jgi:hypothetical protein